MLQKINSLSKSNQTTDTFDLVDNDNKDIENDDVPLATRQRRLRPKRNEAKEAPKIKRNEMKYS